MLTNWPEIPLDHVRRVTIFWHPTAAPLRVINGAAADAIDITPYVSRASQKSGSLDLTLRFHVELIVSIAASNPCGAYTITQPMPGHWIVVKLDGVDLWRGFIYSITEYSESRGARQIGINVRSRDAAEMFRGSKRVTNVYGAGTQFDIICADIIQSYGLTRWVEFTFPVLGLYVVHQNLQLADMSLWDMLSALLWPGMLAPWTNALGVITSYSRDVSRLPIKTYAKERIISINQGRAIMPVNIVKLNWLNPALSKVTQQSQALNNASITAGFFQLKQEKDLYWSSDWRQRAENTYMNILQSCNSGLISFCSEDYAQEDDYHGRITITTSAFAPGLATASLALILLKAEIGDLVSSFIEGWTTPVGTLAAAIGEIGVMLVMMGIGTGHYEIWGQPFDYIHARNVSEAYNQDVVEWIENRQEFNCDMIANEAQADQLAINELKYLAYSSQTSTIVMHDNPNIEVGDIIQIHTGERFYITDYSRDLSRGASSELTINCFMVPS